MITKLKEMGKKGRFIIKMSDLDVICLFENLRVSKNASNVQRMPRLYNRVVCTNFDIYVFITLTSAGGLLIPEGVIRPVVSVSALTWFIRYIYY
jgi:hypothetical protein